MINSFYPPTLAEEWDNVGLQVGDPVSEVTRIAVALDPVEATLAEAISKKAELLVCHHPLIFKPLRQLTPNDETGKLVTRAVRENLAVYSAHTNLDRAKDGGHGTGDVLAVLENFDRVAAVAWRIGRTEDGFDGIVFHHFFQRRIRFLASAYLGQGLAAVRE